MKTLVRVSAVLVALALLGAGQAEARGGRGGGAVFRGGGSGFRGGSSFGRSTGHSTFGRSSSSAFGRSSSSPFSSRSRSSFSSPSRSSFSSRSRSSFSSARTQGLSRSTFRSPTTFTRPGARSTTSGYTQPVIRSVPSVRRADASGSTRTYRSNAAMDRLRNWSAARSGVRRTTTGSTTTPFTATRNATTRSTVTRNTGSAFGSRSRGSFGSRTTGVRGVRNGTGASSVGDSPRTVATPFRGVGSTTAATGRRTASGFRTTTVRGRSFGGGVAGVRSGSVRSGSVRSGSVRSGVVRSSITNGARNSALRRDGGVRYASARAGGVRYSGGSRAYRGRYYGYGGYYGPSWYRPWCGGYYWGYPCGGWGVGIGIGIGVGLGYSIAYWDPWYYDCYRSYWVNNAPPFGFGTVYYGPTYVTYVEGEDYPAPAVVPAQPPAAAPEGAPAAPESPDAPNPDQAPGHAEFGAGIQAFLDGNYIEALKQFRLAVQADKDNGEAWMAVAQSAFAVGVYDEAAQAITEAAQLGAFPRGYRYDPAPMYPQEGRFDLLFQRLETFRKQHPTNADAQLVAAFFYVAQGEKEKANEAITKVLELRPEDEAAPILTVAMLPPLPPEKLPAEGEAAPAAEAPMAPPAR